MRVSVPTARASRAALFALVGLVFFLHWTLADLSYEVSASQDDWSYVLGFSAAILLLGFAIPAFAQLTLAFFGFVLGAAIILLGLLALTGAIALGGGDSHRYFSHPGRDHGRLDLLRDRWRHPHAGHLTRCKRGSPGLAHGHGCTDVTVVGVSTPSGPAAWRDIPWCRAPIE